MLSKIITVGLLAASPFKVSCAAAEPEPTVAPKVVGGDDVASRETYKFLVGLYSNGGSRPFCGGSLLSGRNNESDYVITAAHCVHGSNARSFFIQAYRYDLGDQTEAGDQSEIETIYVHEEYNSRQTSNDIALLKLKTKLPVRQHVHLDQGYFSRPQNQLTVAGWGTLSSGGSSPNILQEAVVPVLPKWKCQKWLGSGFISDTMMCAGGGDVDTCQGDSGGPMFAKVADDKFVLVGLVSWGYGCASLRSPGVYTPVKVYRDWIANTTGTGAGYIVGAGRQRGVAQNKVEDEERERLRREGAEEQEVQEIEEEQEGEEKEVEEEQEVEAAAPSREDKSEGQSRRLDDTQKPFVV